LNFFWDRFGPGNRPIGNLQRSAICDGRITCDVHLLPKWCVILLWLVGLRVSMVASPSSYDGDLSVCPVRSKSPNRFWISLRTISSASFRSIAAIRDRSCGHPPHRMPLLLRCLTIRLQNLLDDRQKGSQLPLLPRR
jgi:hypothetical protein